MSEVEIANGSVQVVEAEGKPVGIVHVIAEKPDASLEKLFVDPAYRHTSAFEDLFSAAEQYVTYSSSDVFSCGARIGSALDKVLSRRSGFTATHTQHTKWLSDRKERRRV